MRQSVVRAGAVLAAAAACARAGAGEPEKAPAEKRAPVCAVSVVDDKGLRAEGLLLLAFENGVYLFRSEDGDEISLREEELRSVKFRPIEEIGVREAVHDERQPNRPDEHEPKRPWVRGPGARRLGDLRDSGKLAEAVRKLEEELRDARSAEEAIRIIERIRLAKIIGREKATPEYVSKLVQSIRNQKVREEIKRNPPMPLFWQQPRRGHPMDEGM